MTKPITEARLRNASQRAVASGHARAAILFGSRVRGTAAPESDWDVCLISYAVKGEQGARILGASPVFPIIGTMNRITEICGDIRSAIGRKPGSRG